MSEGPIKVWREAWKPQRVSTPDNVRVCLSNAHAARAVCGRRSSARTASVSLVTCTDCKAALRADEASKR